MLHLPAGGGVRTVAAVHGKAESRLAGGLLLAAVAAVGLGLAPPAARYAFLGGTDGLTVTSVRGTVMLLALALFLRLSGRGFRLPRRERRHAWAVGLLFAGMMYCNIAAVQYIPVGLASLVYFTYPSLIVLLLAAVVRDAVPADKLLAVALALAGLALMLGVSFGRVDPRGVWLALAAAACTAGNAVWIGRHLARTDMVRVTFHMCAVGTAVVVAATLLRGGFDWPERPGGWLGMAGVTVLQGGAGFLYFLAIPRIGALRSGIVTNLQPLTGVLAAVVLFGEAFGRWQVAGGLMVLAAVWLMQWRDSRVVAARSCGGGAPE